MDCYFWSFSKPKNSTKRPSLNDATIIQANVATSDLDLERPQLVFNLGMGQEDNPTAYNMVYIPALERYYRCTWRAVDAMWIADCEEDTLATWKTGIGALNAYVLRSSAEWDGNIIDNMYPAKGDPVVNDITITAPWTDNDLDYNNGSFVVGTIGKTGATVYSKLTPAQFSQFAVTAFSDAFFNSVKDANYITKAIFDPMQYLSSVTWFPFASGGGGRAQDVYLGYWNTGISGLVIGTTTSRTITVNVPKHPQAATRGGYLNLAPFSRYTLDLRPFGRIAIDPALVQDVTSITLNITVDWISGAAILRVLADGAPIALQQAQLGLSVQLSQVLHNYLGGAMNVLGSVAGGVASAMTGNVVGAIQGGLSAIGSAIDTAYPTVTTSGINAGFASLEGSWHMVSTFYNMVDDDMDHRGRPLCKVKQISTIPGYLLCSDVEVNLPAAPNEIDTIKAYMEGGFYYE